MNRLKSMIESGRSKGRLLFFAPSIILGQDNTNGSCMLPSACDTGKNLHFSQGNRAYSDFTRSV